MKKYVELLIYLEDDFFFSTGRKSKLKSNLMHNLALCKQEFKLFRHYRIRSQSQNKTNFMSSFLTHLQVFSILFENNWTTSVILCLAHKTNQASLDSEPHF